MNRPLYPLKFKPITKYRIWGGNRLNNYVPSDLQTDKLGEIWSLSDVPGDVSIAENGSLKGTPLDELIATYKEQLVGEPIWKKYENRFPLLIKFIDTAQPLSVQVHPNDELAAVRHGSPGKTEMWYIMEAEKDSELIVGFKKGIDREEYTKHLITESLDEILRSLTVNSGDAIYIPAGRVHAIGAGITLAEIQQTSDITYRIFDYNRIDKDGKKRELHTELARDAIDFNPIDSVKVNYTLKEGEFSPLISSPYFETKVSEGEINTAVHSNSEMHILICTRGNATVISEDAEYSLNAFETMLIPAAVKEFRMISKKGSSLIEVSAV